MLRKIVDVLKEVFWIKTSRKRRKPARRKSVKKSPVKKKAVKKSPKPAAKPKLKSQITAGKQPVKSVAKMIDPSMAEVGVITHYFDRIKVGVVKLTHGSVLIGDRLTIAGSKTKFVQKVWSMQIESEDVKVAKKGQIIGLKVEKLVAVGDKVYK